MDNNNNVVKLRPIDREFMRLPPFSKVAKNLFVGGMPKTIDPRFKSVFPLAQGWYPIPAGVAKTTFLFEDEITPGQMKFPVKRLREIARQVNFARRQGDTLVHCAMGLNRSALVAGLALVEDGVKPEQAIEMLRKRRSPWALCNDNFESILLTGKEIDPELLARIYDMRKAA